MRNKTIKIFLTAVLAGLLIMLVLMLTQGSPEGRLYGLFRKPDSLIQRLAIRVVHLSDALLERGGLVKERDALKLENQQLQSTLTQLTTVRRDNDRLRKQLGVTAARKHTLLDASITSIQRTPSASIVLIDKGSADGVRQSMPVMGAGDELIGLVKETFEHVARVYLTDDPRVSISVRVGDSSLIAEARGILNNSLVLNLVSTQDKVATQDILNTTGLDGLPEGLVVGTISAVSDKTEGLFKKVAARSVFDPSAGPHVFVLMP